MEETARKMVEWFRTLPHIRNPVPVRVTIKDETFYGVRYVGVHYYTADQMAVSHGHKKAGEEYVNEGIWLLGRPPKRFKPNRIKTQDTVYRIAGDDRDWFVSCYAPKEIKPEHREYHPFGPCFGLAPWDAPGKIDDYDQKKSVRLTVGYEQL